MTDHTTVMRQALKVLSGIQWFGGTTAEQELDAAVSALRDALAEPDEPPVQEFICSTGLCHFKTAAAGPVAVPADRWPGDDNIGSPFNACQHRDYCLSLKAAAPAAPAAQPLTDEQIEAIFAEQYGATLPEHLIGCARAIERAHGIKGGE